jgi:Acetyltransferase (isoleucine patch superfamily)
MRIVKRVFDYLFHCAGFKMRYGFRLQHLGKRTYFVSPLQIDGCENISIGDNVYLGYKTWIAAMPQSRSCKSRLVIENGVVIGHFNHIYATGSIVIGQNALLADKIYISDNIHDYTNPDIPIKNQPVLQKAEVVIGENSWIGENVSIIGASVGKNSVIGANAVVTKSIPDYSIAVGAPAQVIKRYNFASGQWEKTGTDEPLAKVSSIET